MSKFFNALAVAVLGIALLMGAASASTDDSTPVIGEVPLVYTIDAPASVDFGVFTIHNTNPNTVVCDGTGLNPAQLSLTTNGLVDLQSYESGITVPELSDGKMHKDGSATCLQNELTVNTVDVGASSAAPAAFAYDQATGLSTITFGQLVTTSDTAGDYQITVTFCAIAS